MNTKEFRDKVILKIETHKLGLSTVNEFYNEIAMLVEEVTE